MNVFNRARIVLVKGGTQVKPGDLHELDDVGLLEAYKALKVPVVQRNYINDPGVITITQSGDQVTMSFVGFSRETAAFLTVAFSAYL